MQIGEQDPRVKSGLHGFDQGRGFAPPSGPEDSSEALDYQPEESKPGGAPPAPNESGSG